MSNSRQVAHNNERSIPSVEHAKEPAPNKSLDAPAHALNHNNGYHEKFMGDSSGKTDKDVSQMCPGVEMLLASCKVSNEQPPESSNNAPNHDELSKDPQKPNGINRFFNNHQRAQTNDRPSSNRFDPPKKQWGFERADKVSNWRSNDVRYEQRQQTSSTDEERNQSKVSKTIFTKKAWFRLKGSIARIKELRLRITIN